MVRTLRRLTRTLEFRLLVPLAFSVALVLAVHAWLGYRAAREQIARFVAADLERSTALIESATHDGMLLNRMEELQSRIERLGASPGFAAIRIYGKDGRIALAADPAERGRMLAMEDATCLVCHPGGTPTGPLVASGHTLVSRSSAGESQRSLTVIRNEPACATAGCHGSVGSTPVLGVLDVELSMDPFDAAISRARTQLLGATGVLIVVSGLVSALVIRRLVHEPVARLREGTGRIAGGDLGTRIEVEGRHELAELARSFNRMVADLRGAREEIDAWSRTLEQKVEEKTLALREAQRRMVHVETMASLGKLSATVAHELNNPLSGILAYARLVRRELAEQPLDPALREELEQYLGLVDRECVRCGEIVKNLLAFARGGTSEMAPIDLNAVVRRSLLLIRHHLEMRRVSLRTEYLEGDTTLVADQGQVQQAVLALAMNAVEAMPPDQGREAVLSVRLRDEAPGWVRLEVEDTGVGIPEDLLPHIFEPFVTTKGQTSGVGLGLAVVYGVVNAHGGEVEVRSTPGVGTVFVLRLPRTRADAGRRAAAQPEEVPA